jgi:hypothetical protein
MRVIYVHGVSERYDDPGYKNLLNRRRKSFVKLVADPLGHNVSLFTDAPWGHLRPKLQLGEETYSTSVDDEVNDTFTPQDYRIQDGQLDAASYLEAAVLRTSLDAEDFHSAQEMIRFLSDFGVSISFPTTGEQPHETLARIRDIASSQVPKAGESYAIPGSEFVSTVIDRMKTKTNLVLRPRDWIAREMARRWVDVVWYVGSSPNPTTGTLSGREQVRTRVLDSFDERTRGIDDEPVVILGHSLGGLVSFDAINSKEFQDRDLHRRAKWVLLCFGSQLPIYRQLQIVAAHRFNSRLNGVARFRNLVDVNDPLGFLMNDAIVDREIRSGVNVASAHSAYLDSAVALGAARRELKEIFHDWNKKEFTDD